MFPQTWSWGTVMTEDSKGLEGAEVKLMAQGGHGPHFKEKIWGERNGVSKAGEPAQGGDLGGKGWKRGMREAAI